MTTPGSGARRALADRCPGLLRPHAAEDGLLVRLRIPGGRTTSAVLTELGRISAQLGGGSVQLTSRSNVQLRGLAEDTLPRVVDRVAATGLLPSVTHERVRNIVASPLTGLVSGRPDLRAMVRALDDALCATPELAGLPGRFLFALDDGSADVTSLRYDLGYAAADHGSGTVLVGDGSWGFGVRAVDAVPVLIDLASAFVRLRNAGGPRPWHVDELAHVSALDARLAPVTGAAYGATPPLGDVRGAASVSVPLSLLDAGQLAAVHEAAAGGPVVLTPWRGLVIPGAAGSLPALAAAGLVVDDDTSWSRLTACVGAPGCRKSAISTRAVATGLAGSWPKSATLPIHVSGCDRRCGAPAGPHHDLVAPRSVEAALAIVGGGT